MHEMIHFQKTFVNISLFLSGYVWSLPSDVGELRNTGEHVLCVLCMRELSELLIWHSKCTLFDWLKTNWLMIDGPLIRRWSHSNPYNSSRILCQYYSTTCVISNYLANNMASTFVGILKHLIETSYWHFAFLTIKHCKNVIKAETLNLLAHFSNVIVLIKLHIPSTHRLTLPFP